MFGPSIAVHHNHSWIKHRASKSWITAAPQTGAVWRELCTFLHLMFHYINCVLSEYNFINYIRVHQLTVI